MTAITDDEREVLIKWHVKLVSVYAAVKPLAHIHLDRARYWLDYPTEFPPPSTLTATHRAAPVSVRAGGGAL